MFAIAVVISVVCSANDLVEMQLDSQSSSVNADLVLQSCLPGSLIGNYDEDSNPEGTLTRPGLIGGNGNQPVALDMTANLEGIIDTQPSGSYQLGLDLESLSVTIISLELDLLAGQVGTLDLNLDWDFETFRTFQPDSLFIGIPLTLPLGSGTVSELRIQQTGPADAVQLVPMGQDQYSFTLFVPASITIESEFLGQLIDPPPLEIVVILNGQLEIDGDQVIVVQSFEQRVGDKIANVPGGGYTDVPFSVPTILPPGFTAELLLSGDVDSISFNLNLAAEWIAQGQLAEFVRGDLNLDGVVNLLDVALFVNAIVAGEFIPAADVNCDGTVNHQDVGPFIDLLIG